jgi:hypothetical protein
MVIVLLGTNLAISRSLAPIERPVANSNAERSGFDYRAAFVGLAPAPKNAKRPHRPCL